MPGLCTCATWLNAANAVSWPTIQMKKEAGMLKALDQSQTAVKFVKVLA